MADNNAVLSEIVDALADEVNVVSGIEAAVAGLEAIDEDYRQGVAVLLHMHRERLEDIFGRVEALNKQPPTLAAA